MTFPVVAVEEIYQRPPRGIIPLSKGGDIIINFRQTIDDVLTSYAPGVTVTLVIDVSPPIQQISAVATISGYNAVCRVESTQADLIPAGTIWRCIVSYPTLPTTEVVGMNGTTARADS